MEKERRIKVLSLVTLIVAVLGLTVAFAAMSRTLTINGTANVDAATWDVHFESLDGTSNTVYGKGKLNTIEVSDFSQIPDGNYPATISDDGTKVEGFGVLIMAPGDYASYDLKIVNKGTIDASITSLVHNTPSLGTIQDLNMDENGNFVAGGTPTDEDKEIYENYFSYKVTYTDSGEELKVGDVIPAGDKINITITAKLDREAPHAARDLAIVDLGTQIIYTQK